MRERECARVRERECARVRERERESERESVRCEIESVRGGERDRVCACGERGERE